MIHDSNTATDAILSFLSFEQDTSSCVFVADLDIGVPCRCETLPPLFLIDSTMHAIIGVPEPPLEAAPDKVVPNRSWARWI